MDYNERKMDVDKGLSMDRYSRIAIVGAGAAGLSAAHYLKQLGYHRIKLFESEPQVGGKCRTIEMDGARFDVGAVIATMGYNRVIELADHYQVPLMGAPKLYSKSLESGDRHKLGFPQLQNFSAVKALLEFSYLLYKTKRSREPGHTHLEFGLAKNVNEWLNTYDLENIKEWIVPAFTGFGYGYKDLIPAAYLLKMCELTFANSLSTNWNWFKNASLSAYKSAVDKRALQIPSLMEPLMFEQGYQFLFETIAKQFDVSLNTPIQTISISEKKIALKDINNQTYEFDQLIIATPPSVTSKLMEFDKQIQALFQMPRTLDYHTFLVEFEKPMGHEAWFITENTLNQFEIGKPVVVSRINPNSAIGTCYIYSDESISKEQLENNLEKDCVKLGVGLKAIRKQFHWDYFPHVESAHFDCFYRSLEELQGRNGIYFTGEVANFTTVEHVVSYSQSLVKRFFE